MELMILNAIQAVRFPLLDKLMVLVSRLGDNGFIWIAAAGIFVCFKKTRKCGFAVLISVGIGFFIGNGIMKPFFARPRPFLADEALELIIKRPGGYSFPSGHTLSAFCGAASIFFCNKKAGIPALIFASLTGFSRMYLYVHYPTDVMAGCVFGFVIALLVIRILRIPRTPPKCCKSRFFPD